MNFSSFPKLLDGSLMIYRFASSAITEAVSRSLRSRFRQSSIRPIFRGRRRKSTSSSKKQRIRADSAQVFQKDLGLTPEDVFSTFSHEPLASASIAQVHKATLKHRVGGMEEGHVVAVKVQKPAIEKQMEWDLFSYR